MPNASTTQASSASETTGTPIPLSYGYAWATGKRHAYYMLEATLNSNMDYTRLGIWLLGHGEWDGPSELWINDVLAWTANVPVNAAGEPWLQGTTFSGQNWLTGLDVATQPLVFNWHSGCDSVIGSGLTPASSGPDQGCDVLWGQFPSAIQPLDFSRIAYYSIMRKQRIEAPTNNNQGDPSQFTDIAPIGLWRALRCRLFDEYGNVTGYAFTTNPVWHWVDAWLRRKLFPDYNLTYMVGPDPLPAAVSARFDWATIFASAQYCDGFLANGRRRFAGSYQFAQQTSLQAIESQILLCCRGFKRVTQGQLGIVCDRPRSSVFTFSRVHILPNSFRVSDQSLHTAANRYIAQFRDLLIPAAAIIASITCTSEADPEVTTELPHCFQLDDRIAMGGTGTMYDGTWLVSSVPDVINPGTPEEVDPTTFTIQRKGANYPASVGAGGAAGLLYSRFKERAAEFWHKNNMLARGAVGLGIARQRNKVKQVLDFATCTYDQASRIARYERDRSLGMDQSPYITPSRLQLSTSMFAKDVNDDLAAQLQPGDRVTVDNTLSWTYADDYEVVDPLEIQAPTAQAAASGDTLAASPVEDSGEMGFTLAPYNEGYMYDTSDDLEAGWPSVPGSDPGNDTVFTSVPLADGGNFVFFVGTQQGGSQFQLPSTGYPAANMLAWASPVGASIDFRSAHTVQLCSVDSQRMLTLLYSDDSGFTWSGDINYAALTWLSTDVTNTDGAGMTWLPLTLAGGEDILFGSGVLADGATVVLPAGWSTGQCFALAFIHDMPEDANIMFLVGAYVDGGMVVHLNCSDDSGHVWHGNASVLIFAWKNNMGTVTSETIDGVTYLTIPLPSGNTFNIGCGKSLANGASLMLPANAANGADLEAILGSSDGTYEAGSNHAQGVGACYLDDNLSVHITFNDGSGDTWFGTADMFAVYTAAALALPVFVEVSPGSQNVPAGGIAGFTALVENNSDQAVTWSVDGILGGNTAVGLIDANGFYSAPNAAGSHMIVATSVAAPDSSGQAYVTVTGTLILPGMVLTDRLGNIIYSGGEVVFVE